MKKMLPHLHREPEEMSALQLDARSWVESLMYTLSTSAATANTAF